MKKYLLLLMAFCISVFSLNAQLNKKVIAVYVTGDINSSYVKIISSKAMSRISRSDDYIAVERTNDFLAALTDEQDYQLSGEVRDDQIAALGARFGAKYVAVLDASQIDNIGYISGRLIHVETAVVVKSADSNREVKSAEDWGKIANNVAYRLISSNSK